MNTVTSFMNTGPGEKKYKFPGQLVIIVLDLTRAVYHWISEVSNTTYTNSSSKTFTVTCTSCEGIAGSVTVEYSTMGLP